LTEHLNINYQKAQEKLNSDRLSFDSDPQLRRFAEEKRQQIFSRQIVPEQVDFRPE
jgi:hypothetical protein